VRALRLAAITAGVAALVLVASVATSAPGKTVHLGAAGPGGTSRKAAPAATGPEKLKKTYLSWGPGGVALTGGDYTPIESTTVVCPGHSTCTIEADIKVQAQGVGSSDAWAICALFEGARPDLCPFQGFLSSGFYQVATWTSMIQQVPPGTYTMQTAVWTSDGGTAYNWASSYKVLIP
jgi:hypothetical protein